MPFLPLRPVPLPDATSALYDAWLEELDAALDEPDCDRDELCRRVLTQIYFPGEEGTGARPRALSQRVALAQMDPRNATLEPEYYHETDVERYARVKPLLWLWEMFDRSPMGENVELGVRFRRLLAKRIFKRCGRNLKVFHHVKLSFGYNLEVGDDVVIHRHVLLDDRGGIEIGSGSSISDFANVYSHTHDIVDGRIVQLPRTVIGRGVRITYHATVLAGSRVADDSMVGAGAILTRDTRPHWVHVGIPARPVKEKPAAQRAARAAPSPDPLAE